MVVKTNHGDFEVNDISFADRRKLHRLEIRAINQDGEMIMEKYYDVLEWVMDFAWSNPEETLEKLDDNQCDEVLASVYSAYKEPSKKVIIARLMVWYSFLEVTIQHFLRHFLIQLNRPHCIKQ